MIGMDGEKESDNSVLLAQLMSICVCVCVSLRESDYFTSPAKELSINLNLCHFIKSE